MEEEKGRRRTGGTEILNISKTGKGRERRAQINTEKERKESSSPLCYYVWGGEVVLWRERKVG